MDVAPIVHPATPSKGRDRTRADACRDACSNSELERSFLASESALANHFTLAVLAESTIKSVQLATSVYVSGCKLSSFYSF